MASTSVMSRGGFQDKKPPPMKITILPLAVAPKLPDNFEEDTWAELKVAVDAVHSKQPISTSMEHLYRMVEDLCIHKMAERIYERLEVVCDKHIQSQLGGLAAMEEALEPIAFLEHMASCWSDHCQQMKRIQLIFLYLDRTFVISTVGVQSLLDMGLTLYRTHLESQPNIRDKTIQGLLLLIKLERQGETIDRALLKKLLQMFSSLGTYAGSFQKLFLEATAEFYRAEGEAYMSTTEVPAYLKHAEKRLSEEQERCQSYLDPLTQKPLVTVVEKHLLGTHLASLLNKGFAVMMDADRLEDLERLYKLSGRVGALEALKLELHNYIKLRGEQLIMDESKDPEMVELLLVMKKRIDAVLTNSFESSETFSNAVKDSFEQFINQRANKPAELVAKFLDAKLKSGNKGASDEELEATMDQALVLFRYIQGKDVFEAFYKKDLAKRLLLGKSASIDAEKSMISKLKAECGSQFTNKLEGMFKDIDLSRDILVQFREFCTASNKSTGNTDMHVNVLTSGYWPTYPIMDARLPEELNMYQEIFKEFYLSKHSGRRLVWYNTLGMCVLKSQFPAGSKELSVSLLQAVVLMIFNDCDSITFQDIATTTGIEDKELRRVLQSLACGKIRVLSKEPKGREVMDEDVFHFNTGLTHPLHRIKINSIQLKETEEENIKTNEEVLQDRQYQIDAAIVRIMKTRKTLSHRLLIQELMSVLKFNIKATDLKKRIESLIDREYLTRDKAEATVYNYLA